MTSFRDTFKRRLRLVKGDMTQNQMADDIGISRATLASYLCGKNVPTAETLHLICEVTGCSSDWLLGLSETRWKKIHPAGIYECEQCGINVMTDDIEAYAYCHGCGRKVRWRLQICRDRRRSRKQRI